MKLVLKSLTLLFFVYFYFNFLFGSDAMNAELTFEEKKVIEYKGTEIPFTGKYYSHHEEGIYVCKRCSAPLYSSNDKFDSGCGWPSFDDEIKGAVTRIPDLDGLRTEIVCAGCKAHLGHIFSGEYLTEKNTRHCVNSISLNFIPINKTKYQKAIFALGCFWGAQYFFQKTNGVLHTKTGYIGGSMNNPSYENVCSHLTGHAEAIEVVFDSNIVSYEELVKLFFEIHDPSQLDRQGPDIGEQYRSEIFYFDEKQKETAENLIVLLKNKGLSVETKISKAGKFWKAEEYHQKYYEKNGKLPYCHKYTRRF